MVLLLLACASPPAASSPAGVDGCPPSPNCVSSAAPPEDAEHHVAALRHEDDVAAAKARMKAIVLAMPRTALVAETDNGLRFTFTSALFRFVDDVDVVFVEGRVELRSASRVGHGDMGVNRARYAAIAAAWTPTGAP
jgi:uncharacterized protein (DUF1499 family)